MIAFAARGERPGDPSVVLPAVSWLAYTVDRLGTFTALNHPRGRRLAQKIDHGPCWTRLGHRPEHERAHDAGAALAIVIEVLIELLLLIGGVTVAAALLPLQPKVRLVLSFCGLVLVTVGGALFAFVTYPGETPLSLGAGAGIAGTAWGYAQVTAWLARRTASAITLSDSASEPGGKS